MEASGPRHALRPRLSLTTGQVVYLDLLRAFAAGLVLIDHIHWLTGAPTGVFGIAPGTLGVTVFFLVSGFLIDRSVHGQQADYGLREFLIERASRIYVCFVPALVFTAVLVSALVESPDFVGGPHTGVWQFLGNLLMLQGYPAFQLARRAGIDSPWFVQPYALAEPYWTIPIELFLYIAFGAAFFVFVKRTAKLTGPLRAALALAALPVLYHSATGWGECLSLVWLLGVIGSRWFHRQEQRELQRTRSILVLMGVAATLLVLRLLSRGGEFYDLQKALFLGVLLWGGLHLSARAHWLGASVVRVPAAFFANTSYALYLTHNVIVGWAVMHFGKDLSAWHLAGVIVACQLCASAFWWMFDRHHRRIANWLKETTLQSQTTAGLPQS
jgi:peptidoglycan/LPS O-acetylase OafA/YrhL